MRTKKCGGGLSESGGTSQVVLWVLLACVVIGAGIFILQRKKPPEKAPVVAVATPIPATPTPPPATPEPVIVKATPTPPPVAMATPTPPPATPPPLDFATVARTPALWPPQVALTQAKSFPVNLNGRVVGEAKAPVGTVLKVVRLSGVQAEVEFQGARHWVPVASTDFMSRALATFRNNGSVIPTSVAAVAPAPMPATATPSAHAKPEASDEQKLASKVVVEVVRNRRSRVQGGDFDDKTEKVEMKVKLSNPDLYISADKWKGEIQVFAESILDRSVVKLIITQQFDISIPARGNHEFITDEAATMYDTTGARFGFKYDGWVLKVKDSGGKVLITKTSSPSLLTGMEKAASLEKDKTYDRNTFKEKSVMY
jgi:hypothetical protein